jgi:sugar lactone lactonase YvrE
VTNVTCNDGNNGSITLNPATGGSGTGYTYSDGGAYQSGTTFSGLTAGPYTITAQDSVGCLSTGMVVTVGQPSEPVSVTVASHTNVTCNGGNNGSITLNPATGGSGTGYTYSDGGAYQSSATFSGLTAGPYTITAKDSVGCLSTGVMVTISQPAALSLKLTETNATTYGGSDGSVTATFSGGTASYQLEFNGGGFNVATSPKVFTGLTAGTYTVDLMDANGCTTNTSIMVSQPACSAPNITGGIKPGSAALCEGSMLILTLTNVTGTTPLYYQWQTNNFAVEGATNGSYTNFSVGRGDAGNYVCVVSNACGSITSQVAVVTVNPPPTVAIAAIQSFQFGGMGHNNGQFVIPSGLAVDASNDVYAADMGNHRIQKFDNDTNYLLQWGSAGGGDSQFEFYDITPVGVAVDSSNNVYVTDNGNNRIQKFDQNGNYLLQWGGSGNGNGKFSYPSGIAVDSNNNVYVADSFNQRIQKFDSNGNYLLQWGSSGSGNGQFGNPFSVAVHGTNVYVADYNNLKVQKFDTNGNYILQWGGAGTGNGQFNGPDAVAVDYGGNVYVADYDNGNIQEFDSTGTYLTQWGGPNNGNGQSQFDALFGLAVDGRGYVYAADYGNDTITVIEPSIDAPVVYTSHSVILIAGGAATYYWSPSNGLSATTGATVTANPAAITTYTVTGTGGGGCQSTATVTIVPLASSAPVLPAKLGSSAHGSANITFYALPSYTVVVQTTTNLLAPWRTISTNTMGTNGMWMFTDPDATNPQQYYRITHP